MYVLGTASRSQFSGAAQMHKSQRSHCRRRIGRGTGKFTTTNGESIQAQRRGSSLAPWTSLRTEDALRPRVFPWEFKEPSQRYPLWRAHLTDRLLKGLRLYQRHGRFALTLQTQDSGLMKLETDYEGRFREQTSVAHGLRLTAYLAYLRTLSSEFDILLSIETLCLEYWSRARISRCSLRLGTFPF